MAYTIEVTYLDIAGFLGGVFPPIAGTILALTPPFTVDTATSTSTAPHTLVFSSPSSPPTGPCAVLVRDTGAPGDLFRSGIITGLPPSPGPLTVLTVPTPPMLFTDINAGITARLPGTTAVPTAVAVIAGILTLGTFIPLTVAATGSAMGPGLTITLTAVLTARVFFFSIRTFTLTFTFTAIPAPSGDAIDRNRILSITAGTATLTGPGVPGLLLGVLAPTIASIAVKAMEDDINSLIVSMAGPALTAHSFRLATNSVICARNVVTAPSGVGLQLVISNLFGPPVVPMSGNFVVTIAPTPKAGSHQAYTVTVTDHATGAAVPQANVTLHNFDASGHAVTAGPLPTDASGQAIFNVTLEPKIVFQIVTGSDDGPLHERERVFISPTITVEKASYNTFREALLEDTL